jgi:hypothetical protein
VLLDSGYNYVILPKKAIKQAKATAKHSHLKYKSGPFLSITSKSSMKSAIISLCLALTLKINLPLPAKACENFLDLKIVNCLNLLINALSPPLALALPWTDPNAPKVVLLAGDHKSETGGSVGCFGVDGKGKIKEVLNTTPGFGIFFYADSTAYVPLASMTANPLRLMLVKSRAKYYGRRQVNPFR